MENNKKLIKTQMVKQKNSNNNKMKKNNKEQFQELATRHVIANAASSSTSNSEMLKDPRFADIVNDPRFRAIHGRTQKIKIDKRFQSMFNDKQFTVNYTVDKYGRKINQSSSDNLRKYYDLSPTTSSDEELTAEDEEKERKKEEAALLKDGERKKFDDKDDDSYNDQLQSDEEVPTDIKTKLKNLDIDYARGEALLLTDSSSDETSDNDDDDEDGDLYIEHGWGEIDCDASTTDDSTNRLAACNMDWDRMRASDIMVLCNSFLPPGGSVLSVTIYPSEYGKERLVEENVKGPQELVNVKRESDDDDDESISDSIEYNNNGDDDKDEEGDSYHMEKLRQYQLNRLKYYYAVIVCDSVQTADKLYKECDGLEYESTATKFDLRFVPDDMTFDDEPKDTCTELPDLTKYLPRNFTTTALQQAKVELTWDETNVERKELNDKLTSGKLNDIADHELRKYVAYSSEDESVKGDIDENNASDIEVETNSKITNELEIKSPPQIKEKDAISKYKELLRNINEKEEEKKNKLIEMEYTWGIGAQEKTDKILEKKLSQKIQIELTPFEKIIEKRKQKKKERKLYLKKLSKGNEDAQNSENKDDDDDDIPQGIDLNDPYFAEEFASGNFIESNKKSSKKPLKNTHEDDNNNDVDDKQRSSELALLLDEDNLENDGRSHFSLKKIQDAEEETKSKNRRKRKQLLKKKKTDENPNDKNIPIDDFNVDVNDTRFSSVYTSHLFNIDRSDPHYKKTKGMEDLISEKLKRKSHPNDIEKGDEDDMKTIEPERKQMKKDVTVNLLVKNIKRKLQK